MRLTWHTMYDRPNAKSASCFQGCPRSPIPHRALQALNMPFPLIATKLYLYYDDAWWVYLNKTTGSLNDPNFGNATTYNDTSLFTTPPLRGRYHDGGECV